MDVSGLLRGNHTHLVKQLAKEIIRLQERNKRLCEIINRYGRPPVLVACHPQEVFVYADYKVDLKAIDAPIVQGASDALERYLMFKAGKRHEGLLGHASTRYGPFNGKGCRTVEQLLRGREKALWLTALDEVKIQLEAWEALMRRK